MKNIILYVADKETGTFIEPVASIEEGLDVIKKFESSDIQEGIYEEDFYDIVDSEHCSVI